MIKNCEDCMHYNICDKWWDLFGSIDTNRFNEEIKDWIDAVANNDGTDCNMFEILKGD